MSMSLSVSQSRTPFFPIDPAEFPGTEDSVESELPTLWVFKADNAPWPARARERAVSQWAEVANISDEPAGFYLGRGLRVSDTSALLERIRRSRWWYLPVWSASGSPAPLLADGAADLAEALELCDQARVARQALNLSPNGLPLVERILYFLQVRDGATLVPERDRRHKMLYRYPLAEALASAHDDVGSCLATLLRRGLLEPGKLIDRTRHCRRCNSAHIHFLDVCPHCSSLDIRTTAALPCFDCGYVAPEGDFLRRDGLLCPRCGAAEQHIGVDEEKPILQHVCGGCQNAFGASAVQAHCLDCANVSGADELDCREIAPLQITAEGQSYLSTGSRQQPLAVFETLNAVVLREFLHTVDWALAANSRRADMDFGLLLIKINDTAILQDGSPLAARLITSLVELARQLRGVIRSSDVSTRINGGQLWFYLPFSDVRGARRRIDALLLQDEFRELTKEMRVDVRSMQLPERCNPGEDAQALMKRLGG
ncbi:hypothetical protein [Xylophilus sp. GOD-11R]|uniref:TackOD1 domain-containing metal-binding protein n=1 Tax=Xylophilus sp. GOD-11R TaxID=3089814 RepID=UPI00298BDC86|nr:hypothetical protein [Xylophilus sp. GOD-11R]WPB56457.1 hypothetical protein R9X41_20300 [Xylophilus sp. GOD-11R]